MKKYFAIVMYLSILLINTDFYAQKIRTKSRIDALYIKGWWESFDDPLVHVRFDDTLSYSYYDDGEQREPYTERYWLVADCHSTKVVPYGKAEYIVFKDPEATGTDCAWFIANDNQYLGWIDNSTGHRQSFKRIKAPKVHSPVSH